MKKKKQRVIILLGPAGSGKGTQAKFLIRALGQPARPPTHQQAGGALAGGRVHYCQTGALLRKFTKRKSEAALRIQKIMERGALIPGFVAAFVWKGTILEKAKRGESIIFDGSPRTFHEAEEMNEALRFIGFPMPIVVYVTLPEKESLKRLFFRKRFDDTKAAISGRLRFFRKDVMPVIHFYQKQGHLITINGNQPVEMVWEDIRRALRL